MNTFWTVLLLWIALASGQRSNQRKPEQKQSEPSSETDAAARQQDKSGFIITPLSALPPSVVAPLLPYLRALSSAPPEKLQAAPSPQPARTANEPEPAVPTPVAVPVVPAAKLISPVLALPLTSPSLQQSLLPNYATSSFFPASRLTALPGGTFTPLPSGYTFRYQSVHPSLLV